MDKKYLECLEILELKVGFTLDELKKKWLELSKKYHPDKHATADEILKKLAEDQYKRINEAYTYLKENYGRNQNQYQYQYSSENKPKEERKSRMETDPIFYLENCDILNEENIKIFLNRFPYEKNNILLEAFLALKNKNLNQLRNLSPRIENIVYNQSFEIIVNRLFPNFKNKKQSFFTNIKLLLNENSRNNMLIFLQKVKENLLKNDNYSFWGLNSENQDFKLLSNEYYFLLDNKLDSFIRESDSYLGEIRLGNSKTRGFGQVKLNIKNMLIENYRDKTKFVVNLKNYFELDSLNSIKLGNEFLRENLRLKKEFKEINVKNPNEFIKALFREVE